MDPSDHGLSHSFKGSGVTVSGWAGVKCVCAVSVHLRSVLHTLGFFLSVPQIKISGTEFGQTWGLYLGKCWRTYRVLIQTLSPYSCGELTPEFVQAIYIHAGERLLNREKLI
jgi:hypothetical protein